LSWKNIQEKMRGVWLWICVCMEVTQSCLAGVVGKQAPVMPLQFSADLEITGLSGYTREI